MIKKLKDYLIGIYARPKKMSMTDVINDTVKYYSEDTSRRSVDNKKCKYNGPDGKKCAFARFVDEEIAPELEGETAYNLIKKGIKLKPEVAHITDELFWNEVQSIHDSDYNWDDTGLSFSGKNEVKRMLYKWGYEIV